MPKFDLLIIMFNLKLSFILHQITGHLVQITALHHQLSRIRKQNSWNILKLLNIILKTISLNQLHNLYKTTLIFLSQQHLQKLRKLLQLQILEKFLLHKRLKNLKLVEISVQTPK